jgi:glutaredoxin-related protein
MGELLDGFCKLIEADEDVMSIAELMTTEEIQQWELLVKAFRDINVTNIGKDLKKVLQLKKSMDTLDGIDTKSYDGMFS